MGQINKLGRPTKHFSRNNGVTWWFCWRGGKGSSPRRWWRGCFCRGSRQRRMCTWGSVYTDTARPQHDAETEAPSTTCSTSASHASCQPPYCTTATDTQTHRPTLPYSRTLAHSHTQTQWQVQLLQFMHLSTTTTLAVQHPHTHTHTHHSSWYAAQYGIISRRLTSTLCRVSPPLIYHHAPSIHTTRAQSYQMEPQQNNWREKNENEKWPAQKIWSKS